MRLCWLLGLSLLTAAAGDTYVVAAGVEQYEDGRISRLLYADADAGAVADAFRAAGIARANVAVLTSGAAKPDDQPTRDRLLTALQAVREQAGEDDLVVFFFAGHGVELSGEQYLYTFDTRRDLVADTALPLSLVSRALTGIRTRRIVFLIDSCRNEPDAARGDRNVAMTASLARAMRPRVVGPASESLVVSSLLSCDVGERAYEDPQAEHGAFTAWLVKGLTGAAASGGVVRLGALARYVEENVARWAALSGRQQHPRLLTADGDEVELLRPPDEPMVTVAFDRTPLSTVIRRLAELYGAQIVLGAGVEATVPVTGRIEFQPLSTALAALLAALDLGVEKQRNGIYSVQIVRPATLEVRSVPRGATVLLDGREVGTTPLQKRYNLVDQQRQTVDIRLRLTGYAEQAARLELIAGAVRVRHFRLRPAETTPAPTPTPVPSPPPVPSPTPPAGGWPAGWPSYLSSYQAVPGMQYRVSAKDGMPQVLIPAGEFLMGSPPNEQGRQADEGPQKRVYVSAFWMDLHEVTVGQYQRFCQATDRQMPSPSRYGWEDRHPVSNVTWEDATAYCQWAGRRLPTEAEWEKAARGGREGQPYVWGTQWPPPRGAGNSGTIAGYDDGHAGVSPVGSFAPNGYGLFDMAGNVWEWCQDWYHSGWYAKMPGRDPCNTTQGSLRVLRGGSFVLAGPRYLGAAARYNYDPGSWYVHTGFRGAAGAAQEPAPAATAAATSAQSLGRPAGWSDYLRSYQAVPGMQYRVSPKDGMPQVLVPAGEFLMGTPPNEEGHRSGEGPQRKVFVSAFWMDLHEVTVGQYKVFCQAMGREMDPQYNKDDRHPVVTVAWDEASAYAAWAGRDLPTEAQWEKAARGGTTTAYPWGDTFDASKANNTRQGSTAVGSYAPNGYGLLDMSGNVCEWCRDWYDSGWYGRMPGRDPLNKTQSSYRVRRGGSWADNPVYLRVADRGGSAPDNRNGFLGFRCSEAP